MGDGECEKVVTICRWVPACWYESTLVEGCKKFFIIIKDEDKDDNNGGFFPHWVST